MRIDYPELWEQMSAHFALEQWSVHGPNHWRNVERNGLQLCRVNGADETVVRLFALFHDVERRNDERDPNHGRRSADLVQDFRGTAYLAGTAFEVSDPQLELLVDAGRYHNDGLTSTNLTIGTCWDADRMDLPRVGIIPDPTKMSTLHGKEFAVQTGRSNKNS